MDKSQKNEISEWFALHVYVDESGDLGFSKSSTKFFIAAYVQCDTFNTIHVESKRSLKRLHQRKKYSRARSELKFSRMNDYCRKYFLKKLLNLDLNLGVVILEKKLVRQNLRTNSRILYNWCVVHHIMSSLASEINGNNKLNIVFDKSLPKWRIKEFNLYVTNKASWLLSLKGEPLPENCITLDHVASHNDPCLQAADTIAGAFFQKYERKNNSYSDLIDDKVGFQKYLWK